MSTHLVYPTKTGSFQLWVDTVRGIVGGLTEGLSLLDLCCNECTVTSLLRCRQHVAVDVVDWPTRKGATQFHKQDVLSYLDQLHDIYNYEMYTEPPFDLCVCSDGIEHLTKDQGLRLLSLMPLTGRTALIFTPLGNYMVEPDSTHPDKHRSGWEPEELAALGWSTTSFPKWHSTLGVGAFFAYKGST